MQSRKVFANVCKLTGLMGRWQLMQENPRVICDTGHNVAGIEYIVEQLESETYSELHIIIGMANDKEVSHILELLLKDATYYFVNAQIERALPAKDLFERAKEYLLEGKSLQHYRKRLLKKRIL